MKYQECPFVLDDKRFDFDKVLPKKKDQINQNEPMCPVFFVPKK